jgi:hypothetical protein
LQAQGKYTAHREEYLERVGNHLKEASLPLKASNQEILAQVERDLSRLVNELREEETSEAISKNERRRNHRILLWAIFRNCSYSVTGAIVLACGALLLGTPLTCPASAASIRICDLIPKSGNDAVIGTVLLFVGGSIVGVPLALLSVRLPFPLVSITKKAEANVREQTAQPVEAACPLVTHRDGFWHLFDGTGNLLAIPDEQVSAIRTLGDIDARPEIVISFPADLFYADLYANKPAPAEF